MKNQSPKARSSRVDVFSAQAKPHNSRKEYSEEAYYFLRHVLKKVLEGYTGKAIIKQANGNPRDTVMFQPYESSKDDYRRDFDHAKHPGRIQVTGTLEHDVQLMKTAVARQRGAATLSEIVSRFDNILLAFSSESASVAEVDFDCGIPAKTTLSKIDFHRSTDELVVGKRTKGSVHRRNPRRK